MATAAQGTSGRMRRDDQRLRRDVSRDVRGAKKELSALGAFWTKVSNDWVFNLSAMLAYNFLMSAFPILLVLLAIGGLLLGATGTGGQSSLRTALSHALPNGTGQALLVNVTNNLNKSAGLLFAIGIVIAVFTGSRLFITIENAFGIIYRLRGRNLIRQNLMAIGMMLLYAVLIPIVLLASVLPSTIVRATPLGSNNPLAGFFLQAAGDGASVIVAMILFGSIYVVVPNRPVHFKEAWKGTLVASALLVLYETLFPIYLSLFLHPNNYGSTAGFAVVILIFFYYLSVILLLGAEVNSWASGQRQTAGDIDAILHEVQAHNTARGVAGPTAGTPEEDIEHHEGAAVAKAPADAMRHERTQHKDDEQPPRYAESGVDAAGFNAETKGEMQRVASETSPEAAASGDRLVTDDTSQAERTVAQGRANREGKTDAHGTRPASPAGPVERQSRQSGSAERGTPQEAFKYAPPLTDRQRRALGAVAATGALALAPLVGWAAHLLRGDERPRAVD